MKKLLIICEGHTEVRFCDQILKTHFANLNIEIEYPLIAYSGGGIVPWVNLKNEIELHYSTNPDRFITTFIDYYGLYAYHNFPEWAVAHAHADKGDIMDILEAGMLADLSVLSQGKFIPNILLHEFETLALSDHTAFSHYYDASEFNNAGLAAICALDPETVNNGKATAPSKRLEANIPNYNKVSDGVELCKLIGLNNIRAKCPRFNIWITKLESI
ncbi:hypothetical protein BAX95_00155 [Elizabethkingia meningoseptica]|uniref:DUF4276 family protein n=1 Tax=Elizabethkingia meningoseptica TaxID=238 RepID=UPI00099996B6|nr:DUF4276 family protein [Elizabethkingia meningoseptica]OPC25360.1 hypothetical protein BAX95_00155 [Elizabethkingia meningoseptica]